MKKSSNSATALLYVYSWTILLLFFKKVHSTSWTKCMKSFSNCTGSSLESSLSHLSKPLQWFFAFFFGRFYWTSEMSHKVLLPFMRLVNFDKTHFTPSWEKLRQLGLKNEADFVRSLPNIVWQSWCISNCQLQQVGFKPDSLMSFWQVSLLLEGHDKMKSHSWNYFFNCTHFS